MKSLDHIIEVFFLCNIRLSTGIRQVFDENNDYSQVQYIRMHSRISNHIITSYDVLVRIVIVTIYHSTAWKHGRESQLK